MKKEVSIVLSPESKNYRRLAQKHYGLTDEQMIGMDVHHNPPRHQGGRNIPEHLFVYHNTLHYAVHSAEFILFQREAARKGGEAVRDKKTGIFSSSIEIEAKRLEKLREANEKLRRSGRGVHSPESLARAAQTTHAEKDTEGKSIHARKMAVARFEDPDHPELGKTNAGNLVRMQIRRGLPHGPENRRRVS